MNKPVSILGFVGSLRKGFYNKALPRVVLKLLPIDVKLEISDLGGIPLFNQDLEMRMPRKVKEFKAKIGGCRRHSNRDSLLLGLESLSNNKLANCSEIFQKLCQKS